MLHPDDDPASPMGIQKPWSEETDVQLGRDETKPSTSETPLVERKVKEFVDLQLNPPKRGERLKCQLAVVAELMHKGMLPPKQRRHDQPRFHSSYRGEDHGHPACTILSMSAPAIAVFVETLGLDAQDTSFLRQLPDDLCFNALLNNYSINITLRSMLQKKPQAHALTLKIRSLQRELGIQKDQAEQSVRLANSSVEEAFRLMNRFRDRCEKLLALELSREEGKPRPSLVNILGLYPVTMTRLHKDITRMLEGRQKLRDGFDERVELCERAAAQLEELERISIEFDFLDRA